MARQRKTPTTEPAATEQLQGDEDDRLPAVAPPPRMPSPLQSATAQAPRHPGGMVRICKRDQQRCIWPVHLSGWQQLGWQLVNQSEQLDPEPPPASTTAEPVSWVLSEDLNPAAATGPIEAMEAIEAIEAIEAMEDGHPMPTTEGDSTNA
jgi:hypothetical protein